MWRLLAASVLVATFAPCPAAAQFGVWRADSLLAAGRLDDAETAYYPAAR